jgi:hypothetical protein
MLLLQLLLMVTSILPRSNFHTYIKPIVNRLMNLKESTRIGGYRSHINCLGWILKDEVLLFIYLL